VSFVTLGGKASYTSRHRPRFPKVVVSCEKVCKGLIRLRKKKTRGSEVRKAVKRDLAWSWHLMGNSSYLNRDVGITGGDSELRQINSRVNPFVCLLMFLLFELLEWLIVSIDSIGCMNRLLYLWSIYCN
jgi:hypothetical protein